MIPLNVAIFQQEPLVIKRCYLILLVMFSVAAADGAETVKTPIVVRDDWRYNNATQVVDACKETLVGWETTCPSGRGRGSATTLFTWAPTNWAPFMMMKNAAGRSSPMAF